MCAASLSNTSLTRTTSGSSPSSARLRSPCATWPSLCNESACKGLCNESALLSFCDSEQTRKIMQNRKKKPHTRCVRVFFLKKSRRASMLASPRATGSDRLRLEKTWRLACQSFIICETQTYSPSLLAPAPRSFCKERVLDDNVQ